MLFGLPDSLGLPFHGLGFSGAPSFMEASPFLDPHLSGDSTCERPLAPGFIDSLVSASEGFESLGLPVFWRAANHFGPQLPTSLRDVSLPLFYWLPMVLVILLFLGSASPPP